MSAPEKPADASSASSSSSTKRKRDASVPEQPPAKQPKLAPIFAPRRADADADADDGPFRWLKPSLGPARSCLHGTQAAPRAAARVAAFDLDGTVIKSRFGSGKGKGKGKRVVAGGPPAAWEWWRAVVPGKLKEVHEAGFAVVLVSNQNLRAGELAEWKKKIPLIAAAIPDVPFRIFAATAKDGHRKPMPGMWRELERIFAAEGVAIDKAASYYVGDAAGRAGDFASTDRKFALNAGVTFYTPEEYFLSIPPAPYKLPGFHVSQLKQEAKGLTSADVLPPATAPRAPELVLFVGAPCLGKSTFYRTHFAPAGYAHVNQDTLGSRAKCVKAAEEALAAGTACVVDNTNRDAPTRKHYLDLAKRLKVPARCFNFQGSVELAWHNNLYRAFARPASVVEREPARALVPYSAFTGFAGAYEAPSSKEGFAEVRDIPWVFEGSEEERRCWSMWLQIDGK